MDKEWQAVSGGRYSGHVLVKRVGLHSGYAGISTRGGLVSGEGGRVGED